AGRRAEPGGGLRRGGRAGRAERQRQVHRAALRLPGAPPQRRGGAAGRRRPGRDPGAPKRPLGRRGHPAEHRGARLHRGGDRRARPVPAPLRRPRRARAAADRRRDGAHRHRPAGRAQRAHPLRRRAAAGVHRPRPGPGAPGAGAGRAHQPPGRAARRGAPVRPARRRADRAGRPARPQPGRRRVRPHRGAARRRADRLRGAEGRAHPRAGARGVRGRRARRPAPRHRGPAAPVRPRRRDPHVRRARPLTALALPAAAVLAAAGCGAEVAPDEGGDTVTVSNCGEEIEYRTPERPVAYDMSATEKMYALGLADRLRGIVMPATTEPSVQRSPYKEDYESVEVLGTDVISREIVVEAEADWVLAGWNSGFSEERGITPELLDQVGVQSYMFTESCFDYGDDPVRVEPVEALYTDLRDIGAIFGVQDRAEELIADMEERFAALEEEVPEERAPVFVYDSGTDEPFTSGGQAAPSAII